LGNNLVNLLIDKLINTLTNQILSTCNRDVLNTTFVLDLGIVSFRLYDGIDV
jgi:hypothetical protein